TVALLDRKPFRLQQHLLVCGDGERSGRANLLRERMTARKHFVLRRDGIDEAKTKCLVRAHPPAGEHHLDSDGARKALCEPQHATSPFTAAITGFPTSKSSVSPAKPPGPQSRSGTATAADLRSHPAEKKRSPPPVTMATCSAGSSRNETNASPSAR